MMVDIFETLSRDKYEELLFFHDSKSGLRAIIAIHCTVLGPAMGGLRIWDYSHEQAAIEDVLRLARGMTYKTALAGLSLGGGKAVILGRPTLDNREQILRAFGRAVQKLNGRYITAVDVGSSIEDMAIIKQETDFVVAAPTQYGGSGDPSPMTAYGVYMGMKAAAKHAFGSPRLTGRKIAIQGLGHVAMELCKHLHGEEVDLVVTDIDPAKVAAVASKYQCQVIEPQVRSMPSTAISLRHVRWVGSSTMIQLVS